MKKIFLGLLILMVISPLYAVDKTIKYTTTYLNGFQMYYVKAGTETAATYQVDTGSITLKISGGNQSGTTSFFLTGVSDYDTFSEFRSWLHSHDSSSTATGLYHTNQCMQGEWVVTLLPETYNSYNMTALATQAGSCFGLSANATLTIDTSSSTIMSYHIPHSWYKQTHVQFVIPTITATSPTITFYNDDGTQIFPTVTLTSGSPSYIGQLDEMPNVIGEMDEDIEVRVTCGGAISAANMLIGYTTE